MRFDYAGRSQSGGRVTCPKCKHPMLGKGEIDPRNGRFGFGAQFCDCTPPPLICARHPIMMNEACGTCWEASDRNEAVGAGV